MLQLCTRVKPLRLRALDAATPKHDGRDVTADKPTAHLGSSDAQHSIFNDREALNAMPSMCSNNQDARCCHAAWQRVNACARGLNRTTSMVVSPERGAGHRVMAPQLGVLCADTRPPPAVPLPLLRCCDVSFPV